MCDATVAIAGSLRPLTEIAHVYGFSDTAHLARQLRAASGMPPSAYRAVARTRWHAPAARCARAAADDGRADSNPPRVPLRG
ncbi:uncharacterized protein SOCE26_078330 [Sorangium cellulosum]|uniref:HTH araC/xylS-type domain-containing protein n=1 Tax=Sorangium cellulosum TaxID=56 RepID=A0A2L0F424_SORCE|nr:uncharacterized protein SOCE26_078330 [Sorangium cellulosum]